MYENSFIIVIMIFNIIQIFLVQGINFVYWSLWLKQPFFRQVKTDPGRMQCDVDSLEVYNIIDSMNTKLAAINNKNGCGTAEV